MLFPAPQKDLVVDILEIYFVEHVKKVKDFGAVDDFFVELCAFAMKHGETIRCQGIFERIIGHTNNQRWELADLLAASFRDMGLHSKAYKYFFKARNVEQVCRSLEVVMETGYASEQDLFVARACIEMLIKSPELSKTRQLREHFRSMPQTLLLTFVDILIECVECDEYAIVKQMANVDYAAVLKRDPILYEKVNTVSEKYFDQPIKAPNQMQQMLSNLLGGGGAGFGGIANALM